MFRMIKLLFGVSIGAGLLALLISPDVLYLLTKKIVIPQRDGVRLVEVEEAASYIESAFESAMEGARE
ncbi:MAG TPA: hypothetical protein GX702_04280 [Chloroflexi bacterium]|nr:hypothetical protein [Chloroflexota bacterium]